MRPGIPRSERSVRPPDQDTVPLAYPSHQGLVAPLWRRWPQRFDCLACCVGAAAPDMVDGILGAARGRLGQSYGHGLFSLVLFCVPLGLVVHELLARAGAALPRLRRAIPGWSGARASRRTEALSVLVGGASHLVFDFVSHGTRSARTSSCGSG
jgi:hypothetical protein